MAAIIIMHGSKQPYLSLGVNYGGVKYMGHEYVYHPVKDAFIRKDYVKHMRKKTWDQFVEFVKSENNEESNSKP